VAIALLLVCGPATADPTPSDVPKATVSFVQISPGAAEKIAGIAKRHNVAKYWLRISAKPGGCNGLHWDLDFETEAPKDGETETRCGEIRCLTKASENFLFQGLLVDWHQTEKEAGFVLTAPHKTPENKKKVEKWVEENTKSAKPAERPDK
jgi:iron-sulfur cluster assembly accessory protein